MQYTNDAFLCLNFYVCTVLSEHFIHVFTNHVNNFKYKIEVKITIVNLFSHSQSYLIACQYFVTF